MSQSTVLKDVQQQRIAQDREWGGPAHDDGHQPTDWVHFIDKQLNHASRYAGLLRDERSDMAQEIYTDDFRERMVKVAALAIAAIESTDRRLSGERSQSLPMKGRQK